MNCIYTASNRQDQEVDKHKHTRKDNDLSMNEFERSSLSVFSPSYKKAFHCTCQGALSLLQLTMDIKTTFVVAPRAFKARGVIILDNMCWAHKYFHVLFLYVKQSLVLDTVLYTSHRVS